MCQFGVRKTITALTDVTRAAKAFVRWGGREEKETLNVAVHCVAVPLSFCSITEAQNSPDTDENY